MAKQYYVWAEFPNGDSGYISWIRIVEDDWGDEYITYECVDDIQDGKRFPNERTAEHMVDKLSDERYENCVEDARVITHDPFSFDF